MARIPPTPFGARVCVRGMRWGRDPIRLPKTPLEKNGYALGMRQPHSSLVIWIRPGSRKIPFGARVCVTGMRWGQDPIGLPKPSLGKNGYAPGMRQPHSSLVIWIQLEHEQDLARINLEQGYASGVCACQATPSASPKCLSTKNRYALGMRWPHCSLGIWIRAEHRLDSARTLVSLRNLCAGGMRPIYIYAG